MLLNGRQKHRLHDSTVTPNQDDPSETLDDSVFRCYFFVMYRFEPWITNKSFGTMLAIKLTLRIEPYSRISTIATTYDICHLRFFYIPAKVRIHQQRVLTCNGDNGELSCFELDFATRFSESHPVNNRQIQQQC
uniref:Uncharacterized protein n=1 Tax=Anthurium amnicola TaxID=1678845 RepID=A0A1D1XQ52_9ARAE